MDMLNGVGGGGANPDRGVTEFGDSEDDEQAYSGSVTGTGHPQGKTAVCPVCHRTFYKRTNNQVYDRAECRRKAKNSGAYDRRD
jgi:hypothetical protein